MDQRLGEFTGLGYKYGVQIRTFWPMASDLKEQRIYLGKFLN